MHDPNSRLRALRMIQAAASARPVRGAAAGVLVVYAALALDVAERLLKVTPGAMLAARIELADMSARGTLADHVDQQTDWFTRTYGGNHPDGPNGDGAGA